MQTASAYRLPGIPPFLHRGCEARPTSNAEFSGPPAPLVEGADLP